MLIESLVFLNAVICTWLLGYALREGSHVVFTRSVKPETALADQPWRAKAAYRVNQAAVNMVITAHVIGSLALVWVLIEGARLLSSLS